MWCCNGRTYPGTMASAAGKHATTAIMMLRILKVLLYFPHEVFEVLWEFLLIGVKLEGRRALRRARRGAGVCGRVAGNARRARGGSVEGGRDVSAASAAVWKACLRCLRCLRFGLRRAKGRTPPSAPEAALEGLYVNVAHETPR